jgi:hypothetical protein
LSPREAKANENTYYSGMARIFTSAPGTAKLALGDDWSTTGLPECFRFSRQRLSRLAEGELPSIW